MISLHSLSSPYFSDLAADTFLQENGLTWRRDDSATPAEMAVEFAGRICYLSFSRKQSGRTNREFIRNLIAKGHESVLEHAVWTVLVTGVSRSFSHQFVRHRVGFSYSQLSQQYNDESDATFVVPAGIQNSKVAYESWSALVVAARNAYRDILHDMNNDQAESSQKQNERNRFLRNAARSVLPNATETKIVFTANARSIRNFFKLRGSIEGDIEMREFSAQLLNIVKHDGPSLFEDFICEQLHDGYPIVRYISQ